MSLLTEVKDRARGLTSVLEAAVPEALKETLVLRTFGFLKIPVLFFISPTVVELSSQRAEVKVPLNRRTRNHMKCMYFGVLAAGADCAGGILAMRQIRISKQKISLLFKDFKADFLKRAEGDVHFTCEQGEAIQGLVQQAIETGERVNFPLEIVARVPSKLGDEPVARFVLTLSLKRA